MANARMGLMLAAWLAATAGGLTALTVYKAVPGASKAPPSRWPDHSGLPMAQGRPALVVAAHPRCPCTAATMDELRWLLARAAGRAAVSILVVNPAGASPDWDQAVRAAAIGLPSVSVVRDDDGAIAARFGAQTSGHVLLYDGSGRLRFSGGITGSRGHRGANAGRDSVLSLLRSGASATVQTPVFGCALSSPGPV